MLIHPENGEPIRTPELDVRTAGGDEPRFIYAPVVS